MRRKVIDSLRDVREAVSDYTGNKVQDKRTRKGYSQAALLGSHSLFIPGLSILVLSKTKLHRHPSSQSRCVHRRKSDVMLFRPPRPKTCQESRPYR